MKKILPMEELEKKGTITPSYPISYVSKVSRVSKDTIDTQDTQGIGYEAYNTPKKPSSTGSIGNICYKDIIALYLKNNYGYKGYIGYLLYFKSLTREEITKELNISINTTKKTIKDNKDLFEVIDEKEGADLITLSPIGKKYIQEKLETYERIHRPEDIARFKDLTKEELYERFEQHITNHLSNSFNRHSDSFFIDFSLLSEKDPEISICFLDYPEEIINIVKKILEDNDLGNKHIRLNNLPSSSHILLSEIKDTAYLDKFGYIEGDINIKSETKLNVLTTTYECPSCGNLITISQKEQRIKEPNRCSCGRKGAFKYLSDKKRPVQRFILKESLEISGTRHPVSLNCIAYDDLTRKKFDLMTTVGNKIRLIGILKPMDKYTQSGAKLVEKDFVFETNNIEQLVEDFSEIEINDADLDNIKKAVKEKDMLEESIKIYSTIYGYRELKLALMLQQVGGNRVVLPNNKIERDTIHILIISDPATAKSDFVRITELICPKFRNIVGSGTSKAGITGVIRKDEFLNDWIIEGGAIVMANKGILFIDEGDKINQEDLYSLHEAMENQIVSKDKANIHTKMPAQTAVTLFANPKNARYDISKSFIEQLPLTFKPTFVSRFDLMFLLPDIPNEQKDTKIADKILEREEEKSVFDIDFLRKYIIYAKGLKPKITQEVKAEIKKYYLKTRKKYRENLKVTITARQLEGLKRLSIAKAKWRLSDKVELQDFEYIKRLWDYQIKHFMIDEEGKQDIDLIEVGISKTERDNRKIVDEILSELFDKKKLVDIGEIIELAEKKGLSEDKCEEVINKKIKFGELFNPRKGILGKIE